MSPEAFELYTVVHIHRGLWSSGDTRDKSLGFPLYDLHLECITDTAACSDTVDHSSQSVSCKGSPRGFGSVNSRPRSAW